MPASPLDSQPPSPEASQRLDDVLAAPDAADVMGSSGDRQTIHVAAVMTDIMGRRARALTIATGSSCISWAHEPNAWCCTLMSPITRYPCLRRRCRRRGEDQRSSVGAEAAVIRRCQRGFRQRRGSGQRRGDRVRGGLRRCRRVPAERPLKPRPRPIRGARGCESRRCGRRGTKAHGGAVVRGPRRGNIQPVGRAGAGPRPAPVDGAAPQEA